MNKMIQKVIDVALGEVGYLEKASDKDLYSKTGNSGYNNYTKYGKEMHAIYPKTMDYPAYWCDALVDWLFVKAYGVDMAQKLLGGRFDDYTVESANLYKKNNSWYNAPCVPELGDQVFFKNTQRINHTGLVVKTSNNRIYTVEGNTSDGVGVVPNGGGVFMKSYSIYDAKIAGYGRPLWFLLNSNASSDDSKDNIIFEKVGWFNKDGKWYYTVDRKTVVKGSWKQIDGRFYCFDNSGAMITGWFKESKGDNEIWYYLNLDDGTMVANQWLYVNDYWYYFDGFGVMARNAYIYDSMKGVYQYVDNNGVYVPTNDVANVPSGFKVIYQ